MLRVVARYPRPKNNLMQRLPEGVADRMLRTGRCPYCGTSLLLGPAGGFSRNMFCASRDCNSRFNIALIEGMDWGEFTGTVPDWAYDSHPWPGTEEPPTALPSWNWLSIACLTALSIAAYIAFARWWSWN